MIENIQKTYIGKTAGGYLKNAVISKMQTGNYEVTTGGLPGCIIMLTEGNVLVIRDFSEIVCCLVASDRACTKMKKFEQEIHELYNKY